MTYSIIQKKFHVENRYVIIDETGNIVDDCSGYGFKTEETAKKALWYRFNGGKDVIQGYRDWWNKQPDFKNKVVQFLFDNRKEILSGNINVDKELTELAQVMNVQDFKPVLLKYRS